MDVPTAEPVPSGKRSGLLINRNFALLFSGTGISLIGDFVLNTTLVLWIAVILARGQSWAPLAVSGVLLAAAVPTFLIGPLAGVFVDRWDKRRTRLRAFVFQAVVVAALLPATGIAPLPFLPGGRLSLDWTLGAIYGVVFLVNAANQFVQPAGIALIGDIVPPAERPRAMGLAQIVGAIATIVGPPLAAPALFAFGVQWALIIDALSFLVAFATNLAIRPPQAALSVAPGQRGHFLREFGQGLGFFFRSRVLVTLLVAISLVMLGGGAINALEVFFVTQNLHTAPSLYGLVGAAQAVGVLLGAALAGVLAHRLGLARMIWGSLLVLGVSVIVWSRLTSLLPALAVLFVVGVGEAALNVAAGPVMLQVTPRELIGRVSAVLTPLMTLASLLSIALAGYLDSTLLRDFHATILGVSFGPLDTIFLVAGVLVTLGGLYAMAMLGGTIGASPEPPAVASMAPAVEEVPAGPA